MSIRTYSFSHARWGTGGPGEAILPRQRGMTMHRFVFAMTMLALHACGPQPSPESAEKPGPQPIPSDLVAETETAMRLGREMFEKDQFAARGTDVLREAIPEWDDRILGWVVTKEAGATVVTFVGEEDGNKKALYRLTGTKPGDLEVVKRPADNPELSAEQSVMFAARQTASNTSFRPCSSRYNTVVLPASSINKKGWIVYLIPATTEHGVIIVGGYYRVHVSENGQDVISVQPFSSSCLTLREDQMSTEGRVVAFYVTHHLTDAPLENHVFLQLLNGLTLDIVTRRGFWEIKDGSISYWGELDE